jgi:hypothetical protein
MVVFLGEVFLHLQVLEAQSTCLNEHTSAIRSHQIDINNAYHRYQLSMLLRRKKAYSAYP